MEMNNQTRDVLAMLLQNPQMMNRLGMNYRPTPDQEFRDAANNIDMFGMNAIKRLLGVDIDPNYRVSEDFGALQAMRRR